MRAPRILTLALVGVLAIAMAMSWLILVRLHLENRELRAAFSAVVRAEPWWCPVSEGERFVCAVRDGVLTQIELTPTAQIVDMKRPVQPPIGKTKGRTP